MGLWPRNARAAVESTAAQLRAAEEFPSSTAVARQYTSGIPVEVMGVSVSDVPRDLALSIPGLLRGLTLIATTIAGLPLERVAPSGNRVPLGWLEQPEAGRPRFQTVKDTIGDLILEGRAIWRVHERDTAGQPLRGGCEYIKPARIGDIALANRGHTITIDGQPVDPRDVIAFEGIHDGIRRHGARTIRTVLSLEAAAKRYADTPLPSVALHNESGYAMDDTEIDELHEEYKRARNAEGAAYIKDLKVIPLSWDAAQLQLVEGRKYTNTLIAALLGLPEQYIPGADGGTGGGVTRYANVTQDARALVDYGLKQWIGAFESRLSLMDLQPQGDRVRVVIDGLLRGNAQEQAQVVEILIRSGVMDPADAGPLFDFLPKGRVPA